MRAIAAAFCVVLALTGQQQPSELDETAIVKYVAGDTEGAFQTLARVPHAAVQRDIETLVAELKSHAERVEVRRRLEAIAMMHTEYPLAGELDPKEALSHLDMAHLALTIARESVSGQLSDTSPAEKGRSREFLLHWYALAASGLLSYFDPQDAERFIQEGLKLFPEDPTLLFWHGCVLEFSAVWVGLSALRPDDPALSPTLRFNSGPGVLAAARLWGPAEAAFRRVVQTDPNHFEAHLYLGYVLYSLRNYGVAKTEYELARDRSPDPFVVYMADLLLARLKEDQNHLKDAVQDYEHAIATLPGAQNAYVGLGSIEARLGNARRARELTERLEMIPEKDRVRDPWWAFHTSRVPAADMLWLEQAVRQ